MINNLPSYINLVFILTTFITVYLFYKASNNSKVTRIVIGVWLLIQTLISLSGFYTVTDTLPPRFVLAVAPALLLIVILFISEKGRHYIDTLDIQKLTYLHTVRIPVELVLLWLYQHGQVPQLMTFEGRNFDILAGITAPIIAYFGFTQNKLNKKIILAWNFVCLGLLFNIVINAILSTPFVFQQFAFDQPNVAILYFPYIWLPCCVVPLVLLAHIASIRQLLKS